MTATVEKKPGFIAQEVQHTHYWRSELPETAGKRSFGQLVREELAATGYWRNKKNIIGEPTDVASSRVRIS